MISAGCSGSSITPIPARDVYPHACVVLLLGIALSDNAGGPVACPGTLFPAGGRLANSEFRHELESDISRSRACFLAVFHHCGCGIISGCCLRNPLFLLNDAGIDPSQGSDALMGRAHLNSKAREQWCHVLSAWRKPRSSASCFCLPDQQNVLPAAGRQLLLDRALSLADHTPLLVHALYDQVSSSHRRDGCSDRPKMTSPQGTGGFIAGIGRSGRSSPAGYNGQRCQDSVAGQ